MTRLVFVTATLALVACGKKNDQASGGSKAAPAVDVAGVNALVPAALKDKLVFEQRVIVAGHGPHDATYTMAAPKGWTQDMPEIASLKPPKEPDLGFMTSLHVGTNCDGMCEPKDWAATADKVDFKQFTSEGTKIDKDEKGKHDRTMIATRDDKRYVVYAWWEDGARHYRSCMATLDKPLVDAAPAFEKACKAVAAANDD